MDAAAGGSPEVYEVPIAELDRILRVYTVWEAVDQMIGMIFIRDAYTLEVKRKIGGGSYGATFEGLYDPKGGQRKLVAVKMVSPVHKSEFDGQRPGAKYDDMGPERAMENFDREFKMHSLITQRAIEKLGERAREDMSIIATELNIAPLLMKVEGIGYGAFMMDLLGPSVVEYACGTMAATANPDVIICAIHMCEMISGALAFLHSQGISHNDLYERNICFSNDMSRVVLIDYGLANDRFDSWSRGRSWETESEVDLEHVATIPSRLISYIANRVMFLTRTSSYDLRRMNFTNDFLGGIIREFDKIIGIMDERKIFSPVHFHYEKFVEVLGGDIKDGLAKVTQKWHDIARLIYQDFDGNSLRRASDVHDLFTEMSKGILSELPSTAHVKVTWHNTGRPRCDTVRVDMGDLLGEFSDFKKEKEIDAYAKSLHSNGYCIVTVFEDTPDGRAERISATSSILEDKNIYELPSVGGEPMTLANIIDREERDKVHLIQSSGVLAYPSTQFMPEVIKLRKKCHEISKKIFRQLASIRYEEEEQRKIFEGSNAMQGVGGKHEKRKASSTEESLSVTISSSDRHRAKKQTAKRKHSDEVAENTITFSQIPGYLVVQSAAKNDSRKTWHTQPVYDIDDAAGEKNTFYSGWLNLNNDNGRFESSSYFDIFSCITGTHAEFGKPVYATEAPFDKIPDTLLKQFDEKRNKHLSQSGARRHHYMNVAGDMDPDPENTGAMIFCLRPGQMVIYNTSLVKETIQDALPKLQLHMGWRIVKGPYDNGIFVPLRNVASIKSKEEQKLYNDITSLGDDNEERRSYYKEELFLNGRMPVLMSGELCSTWSLSEAKKDPNLILSLEHGVQQNPKLFAKYTFGSGGPKKALRRFLPSMTEITEDTDKAVCARTAIEDTFDDDEYVKMFHLGPLFVPKPVNLD